MELSIIIVSFNTASFLRKCLDKVYKALSFSKIEKFTEVIVVDNASPDDSVFMVEKNFPKVKILKNRSNLGFGKANNQGIKIAKGKYILLLNSDTEVKNDALIDLLETIKNQEPIDVVGGKLLNANGTIQPSCGFFPNLIKVFFWMSFTDDIPFLNKMLKPYHIEDRAFYQKQQFVDWVTGACFLIKKEVIESVGLLDEDIFMYGEELEWCYRIKKKNYRIAFTPTAEIFHHKGASSGLAASGIVEEFKALIYFYKKHKPAWQIPILKFILMFGALLRIAIFGIIGKHKARLPLYAKAFQLVRQ